MSIPRAVVEELSVLAGRVTALEAEVADLQARCECLRIRVPDLFPPKEYAEFFGELSCDDETND